jgi:hypothetical protein
MLAAILVVAGCNLFRDPYVYVATIASIDAPDTVRSWNEFDISFYAVLGNTGDFVVDHMDVDYTSTHLAVRIWSRDLNEGRGGPKQVFAGNYKFSAGPLAPGEFRVIAHQPDGKDSVKTITVLP